VENAANAVATMRNFVDSALAARSRIQLEQGNDLDANVRMRAIIDAQIASVARISGLVILPYNPKRTVTEYNIDRQYLIKDNRATVDFSAGRGLIVIDDRTTEEWNTDRTILVKE
jgi:hypothetical protein